MPQHRAERLPPWLARGCTTPAALWTVALLCFAGVALLAKA